jgi:hypothetical protein
MKYSVNHPKKSVFGALPLSQIACALIPECDV